ncbi:MAG TPA: sigma-54 dependent transcriptional regulator [Opitutaceae bacterium]|jgi:DNA-binding NtrC family response regulator|nr:sigma-54 dependent transcriptional regulator [Opitutaceae bacterium]
MSVPAESILVVDDQPSNLALLGDLLEPAGYHLLSATNGGDAVRVAARARPSLILLDIMMPGTDGLETCRRLQSVPATREIPVIFITGRAELTARVEGFRTGGIDYIVKPFEADEVLARVRTHLGLARARRELAERNRELAARLAELRSEIAKREAAEEGRREADERLSVLSAREARRWNVAGLVGRSRALAALLHEVERLQAYGRAGVLLAGESGTGKELVARALHTGSPRAQGPFIPVNCVAVPGELMESMFFGHVRGAFTGATADRKGFFELANGGTLFLDEIGDMPAALQAKLLRVLEDGRVTPVGATAEKQVDVRVIAATNANLEARIAAGTFRQDLYFRLARTTVRVPPLRERRDDIPLLAAHFIGHFSSEMGLAPPPLTSAALAALAQHAFPGNVRELRNLIESALIASSGREITPAHLRLTTVPVAPVPDATPAQEPPEDLPLNLDAAERMLIRRALNQTGGNIAEAARLLGVHRSRIYRVLEAVSAR